MKLATLVLTHNNQNLTRDTVDSIKTWVGDQILVLVDQVGWSNFQDFKIGSARIEEGLPHGHNRSPYRNYTLGLKKLYEYWPNSDWFLYVEYDCLFVSSSFKDDLKQAEAHDAWMAGVDLRRFEFKLPLLEEILNQGTIKYSYYLLGCCQFLHNKLVSKLYNSGFLDNLLERSKDFKEGFFPGYERWAFEEELWPTVAVKLGGSLLELVCWKGGGDWQEKQTDNHMLYMAQDAESWRGKSKYYSIRNRPAIAHLNHETSIIHPIKELNTIRQQQKNVRRMITKRRFLI